jgi:protein-S-isoprenylcysteine O-methyltransferase Ste14
MDRKRIVTLFFLGLLLLGVLEIVLAWVLHQVPGLPVLDAGWLTPLTGLLAVLAGGFLVIWSVWIQYTQGQGTPAPMAATKKLIVTGPYAFTRNPMTLGAALFYLGIAFWMESAAALVLVLLVFTALLTYIYFHETQELSGRFGADYHAYRQRTPFLIPRVTRNSSNANFTQAVHSKRKR